LERKNPFQVCVLSINNANLAIPSTNGFRFRLIIFCVILRERGNGKLGEGFSISCDKKYKTKIKTNKRKSLEFFAKVRMSKRREFT